MFDDKIKVMEDLGMLDDLFGENDIKKQPINTQNIENNYFLLNLEIPSPKKDIYPEPQYTTTSQTIKLGFLEILEKIHDEDLHTNNPWINYKTATNKNCLTRRYKKKVHFNTTEIIPAAMPHCQRYGNYLRITDGKLHAPGCITTAHECPDVLGDHAWYNRVFILESCVRCPTSLNDFYEPSQDCIKQFYELKVEKLEIEVN